MYKFGKKSKEKLSTIRIDLQSLLLEAIKIVDFSVIEGHRGIDRQNAYHKRGLSKVKFPEGKHNKLPSEAVDIAPYPYPANDLEIRQAYYLAGIISGIARVRGIDIRIGCDWNRDGNVRNDRFQDVWHIELVTRF